MTVGQTFRPFNPWAHQRTWFFDRGVVWRPQSRYPFELVFLGGSVRLIVGMGLLACACLIWLAPGVSAAGSPQDSGVYDQYTEQIPTAGGSQHSGTAGGPG